MVAFDDDTIGVAEETQLTEEDQTRYHALLLATDRIDHTVQRLDEVLTVLLEFHTHVDMPLARQFKFSAWGNKEGEELVLDEDDDDSDDPDYLSI